MATSRYQLTTFLYGLGGGRRRVPAVTGRALSGTGYISRDPGAVELVAEPVTLLGTETPPTCPAIQHNDTACGATASVVALATVSAELVGWLSGRGGRLPSFVVEPAERPAGVAARFALAQSLFKRASLRRSLWPFAWPDSLGTPPWGAARVMTQGIAGVASGVRYFDRMVVDTSMRQRTRTLTAAAKAADLGYPVLLYSGGDTSTRWSDAVPRHVVVLHQGPPRADPLDDLDGLDTEQKLAVMAAQIKAKLSKTMGQDFDPSLVIYDPATGRNTPVTLAELTENRVPPAALGGWPHLVWMVAPATATERRHD